MPNPKELAIGAFFLTAFCGLGLLFSYDHMVGLQVCWGLMFVLLVALWISERQKVHFWMAAFVAVVPTTFIVASAIHNSTG